MSEYPKISIVILNFNGQNYLKQTIPPLLDLNYPNYDIVLVDNNSTDGSLDLFVGDPKIKFIHNPRNYGYSKGKNIGINAADGKYILLLDNDILINDGDILDKLLEYYRHKGSSLISVAMLNTGETSTTLYGAYFGAYGIKANKRIEIDKILNYPDIDIPVSCPHGASMFFSKSVWEYLGGYDESQPFNLDDDDIGCRAWIMGVPCYIYHQSYFVHLGAQNRVNNKSYCWGNKYYFSGFSRVVFKNYMLHNIFKVYPLFVVFAVLKMFKQFIYRKDINVMGSFLFSIGFFIGHFADTMRQRHDIQSRRTVSKDAFLKIQPTDFVSQ